MHAEDGGEVRVRIGGIVLSFMFSSMCCGPGVPSVPLLIPKPSVDWVKLPCVASYLCFLSFGLWNCGCLCCAHFDRCAHSGDSRDFPGCVDPLLSCYCVLYELLRVQSHCLYCSCSFVNWRPPCPAFDVRWNSLLITGMVVELEPRFHTSVGAVGFAVRNSQSTLLPPAPFVSSVHYRHVFCHSAYRQCHSLIRCEAALLAPLVFQS